MECLEEDDDELRQAFAHLSPEEEVDEFINGYLSEAKLVRNCYYLFIMHLASPP